MRTDNSTGAKTNLERSYVADNKNKGNFRGKVKLEIGCISSAEKLKVILANDQIRKLTAKMEIKKVPYSYLFASTV